MCKVHIGESQHLSACRYMQHPEFCFVHTFACWCMNRLILCRYFRHDYQKAGCVYYWVCLSEQIIKVTQAHLILVYRFHKLDPFGMGASPFIFATTSNKIVQCLRKIDKTLRKPALFHS